MIFCVEDDGGIRELMLYTLRASGFEAEGLCDGHALFAALSDGKLPSLVMLDVMLPGMDGIEILKRLRANQVTAEVPIIMATAKGTEYDKVLGLDLGADDYLCKPFGMMEMVSHIRAVLRRTLPKTMHNKLVFGQLHMDIMQHRVLSGNVPVQLTLKEYELLRLFMEHPGRVFTRSQLLEQVWGVDYLGESRTVDVHIGTLRTKLGTCGGYIHTVRGVGYRLEDRA